ncbi:WD40 repeat-like protein [Mycena maculata]|uniref:WD40 repeat-like protein n=1 Tax=Mycena maculata TaxID=230809 RepID=A0AAD7NVI6_9AGAR|nr:WD40 repeat-like protein [Mycena maculata]
MAQVYSFVEQINFLSNRIKQLQDTILGIVKETFECALFIQEYSGHGFGGRLIRNTWSDTDSTIDKLSEALMKLKEDFDRGVSVQTIFHSASLLQKVETLVQLETLKWLNPVDYNAADLPECLPGTCVDILSQITKWAGTASTLAGTTEEDPAPLPTPNILWMHGVAGAGKSTISTTVSQHFRKVNRLGAYLFFDRGNPAGTNPASVIRTVAHTLAKSNLLFRKAICSALEEDPTLASAPIRTQFKKLLLEPLIAAQEHVRGPIIIILDALDECGDSNTRKNLVSLIAKDFPTAPRVFRFFVTSRPVSDIADQFHAISDITQMQLDIATTSTKKDILAYLCHTMENIRKQKDEELDLNWPGEARIQQLADSSGGLFIWASTACKFIEDALDVDERLDRVLTPKYGVKNKLDALYEVALQNSVKWDDDDVLPVALAILGVILVARVPLNDEVMNKLLDLGRIKSHKVLQRLGCVAQWSPGNPAVTLHASFGDYLTDPARSGNKPWFIDSKIHNEALALRCLQVLNHELRFNICVLEDSHLLNGQVLDLPDRIDKHISAALSYASQFWAIHLQKAEPDNGQLLAELLDFMHNHFLHWLEILSLLGLVSMGNVYLGIARKFALHKNSELANLIHDSHRFLAVFAPQIAQSVLHIYISAIPFSPSKSLVRKHYISSLSHTVQLKGELSDRWPGLLKTLHHTERVHSVAFSPDEKRIVSSDMRMVCIWDSETGAAILRQTKPTSTDPGSVAFSPDSRYIAYDTRDYTVCVLDLETGTAVGGALEGHTGPVTSVVFSPDGKYIASGSDDMTICVWDHTTRTMTVNPFQVMSSVYSVDFSPDGQSIVSGSEDGMIRVWDSNTGAIVTGPFGRYWVAITSVMFSPNGMQIASGSGDKTICVWDSTTGHRVAGPFEGHTDWVRSVAFSPDGIHIVSGSDDKTICAWNSATGAIVAGPIYSHDGSVLSVAFSPDGSRIVSGSEDKTVRIWDFAGYMEHITDANREEFSDTDSGNSDNTVALSHLPHPGTVGVNAGHTHFVTSVAFSPDGRMIVSASWDATVCLWDSKSGALLLEPFKHLDPDNCVGLYPDGKPIPGQHPHPVNSVAFSPDGKKIVSGSRDKTLRIWDSATGGLIGDPFTGHTSSVSSVAFLPDGIHIVSGSRDHTILVWDSQTGTPILEPLRHPKHITSVAVSPDGKQIISGSADKAIRIWDLATGDLIAGPFEGHTSAVTSVAYSPQGSYIVSGSVDRTVRIWNLRTRAPTVIFEGHTGSVNSVGFSPDGKNVVSSSDDKTILVWDSETGDRVAGPFISRNLIMSVAFSPDGTRIVSGSFDKTIRVWKLNSGPWGNHPRFKDGWIMGSESHLMWIPPWLREEIYLPWNPVSIPFDGRKIHLDLAHFVHGTEWQKCIWPMSRDAALVVSLHSNCLAYQQTPAAASPPLDAIGSF